mmetsp:Transcript_6072/g.6948  ORF Transcript_6072/g.6948 Transcript_6072/m.6948 type:complete len:961 (-) Transcript_6072:123-3005(-)
MPLLTKKFTRNSLKRANVGGASISKESEDPSKTEKIRMEMARVRANSMRNRNALTQQRRHRSLSRGPSSPYRSFGLEDVKPKVDAFADNASDHDIGPTVPSLSHPNDEYGQAYNEAEILLQMSSLTEPTWAPSIAGGVDISTHRRQKQQNQRSRTQNYNTGRYQTRFQYYNPREHQNHATNTLKISTSNDQKGTKILLLDNKNDDNLNSGNKRGNNNHGHHERASVGEEGIEIHRVDQDEGREDEDDDNEDAKTPITRTDRIPTLHTQDSELRDGVTVDHISPSTLKTTSSSATTRRSKTRSRGEENNLTRARGRSGRPSSSRKSKKRSSSVSSRRSTQSNRTTSTAPNISKYSSTSTSPSTIKSKADTPDRKRNHQISSSPYCDNDEIRMFNKDINGGKEKDDDTDIDRYINIDESTLCSRTDLILTNNAKDAILDTSSTIVDQATSTISQATNFFATDSLTPDMSPEDCPPTPSSVVEAARMSLRPKIRRSNSDRSITSTQSESIISTPSHYRRTVPSRRDEKSRRSPSVTPSSPIKTRLYTSRTHKLAQDIRVSKIHKQRQQKKQEQEIKQQQEEEEREQSAVRAAAVAARSTVVNNGEEPQHTTIATLLYDLFLFYLVVLLSLPRYVISSLWWRIISKKWNARRKTVLVTGASSPLGSETARQFATEGANLVLISHPSTSSKGDLDWLIKECRELGSSKVRNYTADLSNAISAEMALRQAAKDFNDTFDVVVLNGENMSHGCLFEEILDVKQIEKMIKENTLGCILALYHVLKHVPKTSDSRIVILSSTSGIVASPYKSVYSATHHALKGFCDSIRMELNDTYTNRRAPKVCLASFPDLVCQYSYHRDNADHCVSRMGAMKVPTKTHSWAGIPLQHAVHDLLRAVAAGKRDFGAPRYVNAWNLFRVVAPDWADFSVLRHVQTTQYRPVEVDHDTTVIEGRKGGKNDMVSVSNKTWT